MPPVPDIPVFHECLRRHGRFSHLQLYRQTGISETNETIAKMPGTEFPHGEGKKLDTRRALPKQRVCSKASSVCAYTIAVSCLTYINAHKENVIDIVEVECWN